MSQAKAILRNLHALSERRYVGDTNASDTLVDFADAVKRAKLTARQSEALRLVYVEDLTQKVAGERMGVSQQACSQLITSAEEAIVEALEAINGEVSDNMAKVKLFKVRALEDVDIDMEEVKRVKCVIFGEVPEGAGVRILPNSTTVRWTNLHLIERKFDGTVTLVNLSGTDGFSDCIEGHPDGSYTEMMFTNEGEFIENITSNAVDFKYVVQDVPYAIRKGDTIAKAEVTYE